MVRVFFGMNRFISGTIGAKVEHTHFLFLAVSIGNQSHMRSIVCVCLAVTFTLGAHEGDNGASEIPYGDHHHMRGKIIHNMVKTAS